MERAIVFEFVVVIELAGIVFEFVVELVVAESMIVAEVQKSLVTLFVFVPALWKRFPLLKMQEDLLMELV